MATLKPHSNGPLYRNTVIGTLAVDGGLLHLVQQGGQSPDRCTKFNSHASTASVPTSYCSMWTVPLHCKGLSAYGQCLQFTCCDYQTPVSMLLITAKYLSNLLLSQRRVYRVGQIIWGQFRLHFCL